MKIKIPAQRINQSNNKNSIHRLPEQQEYDTGQEYINPLTQILCNSISIAAGSRRIPARRKAEGWSQKALNFYYTTPS